MVHLMLGWTHEPALKAAESKLNVTVAEVAGDDVTHQAKRMNF